MSLISGLVKQKIDYIYSITRDAYGDKTLTLEYQSIPCRWQEKIQQVIDKDGEEKKSSVEVWIYPKYSSIQHDWQITKDSEDYFVVSIEKKYDLGGNLDHIKLFLV
jgi:hypothetical protein